MDTAISPTYRSLDQWLDDQSVRRPSETALICGQASLSFAEWNASANQVAFTLRAMGVQPGDFVALLLPRGFSLMIGMLGILKAGAAYVPIDPEYPADRVATMVSASFPKCVVSDLGSIGLASGLSVPQLLLDAPGAAWRNAPSERPHEVVDAEDPAYMIFTSGSTGLPKGVVIPHRAIVHSIQKLQEIIQVQPGECGVLKASISFDFSLAELFLPQIGGGALLLIPPGAQCDPASLAGLLRDHRVAYAAFVPTMLDQFLARPEAAECGALRRVFCNGEMLTARTVRLWQSVMPGELYNMYGPAEAAVQVTSWQCTAQDADRSPPIGRPIAGNKMFVVDAQMKPVPDGELGELVIGGEQVGLGYRGNLAGDGSPFFPDPESPGRLCYRTGDLGVRRADGIFEFSGRADQQVKIRGFRVETSEVEIALCKIPSISRAAVIARPDAEGRLRLIAYLQCAPSHTEPTVREIRAVLAERLPSHMLPSRVVWVTSFPTNPSGKLDRGALPPLDRSRPNLGTPLLFPANDRQRLLASVWESVLELDGVGIDDPFFDLGGDSLAMIRAQTLIEEKMPCTLEVAFLFTHPTIRSLDEHWRSAQPDAPAPQSAAQARAHRQREAMLARSPRTGASR